MTGPGDLIFVNLSADVQDEVRRQVRSRAAQHSHRVGPRLPRRKSKPGPLSRPRRKSGIDSDESASITSSPVLRGDYATYGVPVDPQKQSATILAETSFGDVLTPSEKSSSGVASTGANLYSDSGNESKEAWQEAAAVAAQMSEDLSLRPPPCLSKGSRADPFETYPVPAQPEFARLLDHLPYYIVRGWRAMESTASERAAGLLWIRRMIMSDPTYFYVNMVSCADDLIMRGLLHQSVVSSLIARTVEAINATLRDAIRPFSQGTILAVGRIAFREIVVGDRSVGQYVHRPAHTTMLAMGGGLDALDMPAICRRHILWADRIIDAITSVSTDNLERRHGLAQCSALKPSIMKHDVEALRRFYPRQAQEYGF